MFNFLPIVKFKNRDIVDITKGIKIADQFNLNLYELQNYAVQEGDRPEDIAHYYYEDATLAWLVLLPNVQLDPYYQWPMITKDFDNWMIKKYGSIETAMSTILHYTHSTKNITISKTSYDLSASLDYINAGDYRPVYAYDHYSTINDNNRHIKLVSDEFLPKILSDLKDLFDV